MTKLRKTPQAQRQHYIYESENGYTSVLFPGVCRQYMKDGTYFDIKDPSITPELIASLHKEDDKEVYTNLKYLNYETPEEREKRIANKKKWNLEHMDESGIVHGDNPYENPPKIIRFNFNYDNDEDYSESNSRAEYEAVKLLEEETVDDPRAELVRQYVSTLSERMQSLYYYIYVLGFPQSYYVWRFGLSKSTVSEGVKSLNEKIFKHFSK